MPIKKEKPWMATVRTVVGGIALLTIGLFVGDRQKLTVKNEAQDAIVAALDKTFTERANLMEKQTAEKFAEVTRTLTALTARIEAFQNYPNTAAALKKEIIDEILLKMDRIETSWKENINTKFELLKAILENRESTRTPEVP